MRYRNFKNECVVRASYLVILRLKIQNCSENFLIQMAFIESYIQTLYLARNETYYCFDVCWTVHHCDN